MFIKDKAYWKEYNAKRKVYIQQKNKERYSKGSINTTDKETTKNNTTDTTNPQVVLKKDTTNPDTTFSDTTIQPINTTQKELIQPPQSITENVKLSQSKLEPCFHCRQYPVPNLGEAYCLVCAEWLKEKTEWKERVSQRDKIIKELQQPINPTIELWKDRYFKLEKKTNQQLSDQQETINRLKEKLREKVNENQVIEQKHRSLENPSQNNDNSPTKPILVGDNIIPCLFDKKHKKTIFYSCPDPCFQGKSCSNCGLLLVRP